MFGPVLTINRGRLDVWSKINFCHCSALHQNVFAARLIKKRETVLYSLFLLSFRQCVAYNWESGNTSSTWTFSCVVQVKPVCFTNYLKMFRKLSTCTHVWLLSSIMVTSVPHHPGPVSVHYEYRGYSLFTERQMSRPEFLEPMSHDSSIYSFIPKCLTYSTLFSVSNKPS